MTVTVCRLASTTVQFCGESSTARHPRLSDRSRTRTARCVMRLASGLAVGLKRPSADVSTRNTPWNVTSRWYTGRGPPGTTRSRPQNVGAVSPAVAVGAARTPELLVVGAQLVRFGGEPSHGRRYHEMDRLPHMPPLLKKS